MKQIGTFGILGTLALVACGSETYIPPTPAETATRLESGESCGEMAQECTDAGEASATCVQVQSSCEKIQVEFAIGNVDFCDAYKVEITACCEKLPEGGDRTVCFGTVNNFDFDARSQDECKTGLNGFDCPVR